MKNKPLTHEKSNFYESLTFAILPLPNAWFSNPRQPDSDPRISRKRNLEASITKYSLLVQGTQKAFKMRSLNPLEIDKNQAWTSNCPLLCSPKFQDRLRVSQEARVQAPRMPNDNFGNQIQDLYAKNAKNPQS